MSRDFPDWVNPWKAAEGNRNYRGSIALSKMDRLVPLLANQSGLASFEASFRRDELGFTIIRLQVDADLPLVCQASLDQFMLEVRRTNVLAAIADLDEQDLVPGHYETVWVESGRLEFLSLVQDELILEVPQVPRKPEMRPVLYSTDPDDRQDIIRTEPNKPFADLDALWQSERTPSKKDQN
jgi:uncharacterized protein